jgi:hypothetical protein
VNRVRIAAEVAKAAAIVATAVIAVKEIIG